MTRIIKKNYIYIKMARNNNNRETNEEGVGQETNSYLCYL